MNKRNSLVAAVIALVVVGGALALTPVRNAIRGLVERGGTGSLSEAPPPSPAPPMAAEAMADSPARGDVALDVRRQQLIGVRTAPVVRGPIAQDVRVVGTVRYDETRQAEINTRVDGWIRELYADFTGKPVRRGDALFTLYSPELVTTQNEYLLALRGHSHAAGAEVAQVREYADRLVQASRDRLARWDMSEADIQELERRGKATDTITVRSPVNGVIVEKMAVQGMRVMAGQTLFRVVDLSTVWVEANVHEQDMAAIRIGQVATMTLDAYPGESFTGRAAYIHTAVDEATRTLKVRFQFANGRGRLRPGMYANLDLRGASSTGLTVPADAVLDSGGQRVVFVAQGDGYFTPRPVKIGRRLGDAIEVVDGLKEGEQVATGATFFLDSESQLRAGLQNYELPQSAQGASAASGPALDIAFRAQPDPPKAGDNNFEVVVKDPAGQPVTDAEVTVQLFMPAMPTMNMPAMRNETTLPHVSGGVYRGPGQVIMAGRWDVTVTVGRGGQQVGRKQFAVVAR
jgi:RND family efflux transporter MFP subunit